MNEVVGRDEDLGKLVDALTKTKNLVKFKLDQNKPPLGNRGDESHLELIRIYCKAAIDFYTANQNIIKHPNKISYDLHRDLVAHYSVKESRAAIPALIGIIGKAILDTCAVSGGNLALGIGLGLGVGIYKYTKEERKAYQEIETALKEKPAEEIMKLTLDGFIRQNLSTEVAELYQHSLKNKANDYEIETLVDTLYFLVHDKPKLVERVERSGKIIPLRKKIEENKLEIPELIHSNKEYKCGVCAKIGTVQDAAICVKCGRPHHNDCVEYNEVCTTMYCGSKKFERKEKGNNLLCA